MLTVVCWRWKPASEQFRSVFRPQTVTMLRDMVARHYPRPHRFVCVTDAPKELDQDIETIPDFGDFNTLGAPTGPRNPSCYRRLRAFHPDIASVFGPRFIMLDLDTVIVRDVTPIFDRADDFVMAGDTNPKTHYNGSLLLMTAGARPKVWTDFDPPGSIKRAYRAGHHGSDQAWISFCLGPKEKKFTKADGVYSFRNDLQTTRTLPADARLVIFHGRIKPWSAEATAYPWIKEHYCGRELVQH